MYIANLLSQNPGVPHGSSFYLRGVAQSRFDAENHKEIFDTYVKLTEGSDLVVGVIWELWSLTKVDSIAPDATAFPGRGQKSNILNVVRWEVNAPEKLAEARKIALVMADTIATGQPDAREANDKAYANYGS